LIAENLLLGNGYFRGLGRHWQAQGVDPRVRCVRVAKRFCRIAYRMVAGRQVFRHPSCRERHKILGKLSTFYCQHNTQIEQILRDLRRAADWIPPGEYAAEAEPFLASLPPETGPAPPAPPRAAPSQASGRRRSGPCPLSEILPEVFLRLGVKMVQSSPKGETDLT
jgi:hypothetical protein